MTEVINKNQQCIEHYAKATAKLANLAMDFTGGARVAAQVLLSAYNGEEWQLNITELCLLDDKHYSAALAVIHGRTQTGIEPHTLITNGSVVFEQLCKQWKRFNVKHRMKKTCTYCNGTGDIYKNPEDEFDATLVTCTICNGDGFYAQD